jgi:hypothetical protein
MKKSILLLVLIMLAGIVRSQCAYDHVGNSICNTCSYNGQTYYSPITAIDSVRIKIDNFANCLGCDECFVVGIINCSNDSVHLTGSIHSIGYPYWVAVWGWGKFYSDTLRVEFMEVVPPPGGGWDTNYFCKVYDHIGVGINPLYSNETISIFPNPATRLVTIKMPQNEGIHDIQILNILGIPVIKQQISDKRTISELEVSELTNGIYLIQITNQNGKIYTSMLQKI